MVEVAREGNGKFARKAGGESNGASIPDPAIIGSAAIGDDGKIDGVINPAEISAQRRDSENVAGGGSRGRGRPKGSGKKDETKARPETQGKLDLDSLNFTLFFAHDVLSKATKTPELALTDDEAKTMAARCAAVMQHYNINASQKAVDWGNLLFTGGLMYSGKIYAINARQKTERAAKREQAVATVRPFAGGNV